MSYKKIMKSVNLNKARMGLSNNIENKKDVLYDKYNNFLPSVYQGPMDRFEKYSMFDAMEQDSTINQAMDIITDYVTQNENEDAFYIDYPKIDSLPESQILALEQKFDEWMRINSWKKRIHGIMREVFKYGDCILIRDPETMILNKVNIYDVMGVTVDNDKTPTEYIIKNVDLNVPLSVASSAQLNPNSLQILNTFNTMMPNSSNNIQNLNVNNGTGYAENDMLPIAAKNVVQLTLNVDDNVIYPFGRSILENIYKIYIQKMLLQDCVLLYRIKNATEKLVFKIPMGGVPAYARRQYLERLKNEMSQRRIPSKETNTPFNTIDVAYNSIPMNEDFWLPIDDNGNGPTVEKLPGGAALGEINDLVYWNNEEIRGLKVPSSWIPYGPSDGNRVNPTSKREIFVQEQRFLLYCTRLQNIVEESFDREFKYYLNEKGVGIDNDSFFLKFYRPANITELTKQEIDQTRLQNCASALGISFISKQYAMRRYLGWTDEEIKENQRLLLQEQAEKLKGKKAFIPQEDQDQIPGLRTIGVDDIPSEYLDTLNLSMNDVGDEVGGLEGNNMPVDNSMDLSDMGGASMGGNEAGGMAGI